MDTSSAKAIFLILIHLCSRFGPSDIGEVSHLVQCLLQFVVALALDGEAQICRVGLIAGIGPLALGRVPLDQLLRLFFRAEHFEFLDDRDGASMPDMLHQSYSLLQHRLLKGQEVVNVESVTR